MTIKILNVYFSFKLEPDEFGLHSVEPGIKAWIAEQRKAIEDMDECTMTVDPVTDAPGPAKVRKVRGPNKAKANGPTADERNANAAKHAAMVP